MFRHPSPGPLKSAEDLGGAGDDSAEPGDALRLIGRQRVSLLKPPRKGAQRDVYGLGQPLVRQAELLRHPLNRGGGKSVRNRRGHPDVVERHAGIQNVECHIADNITPFGTMARSTDQGYLPAGTTTKDRARLRTMESMTSRLGGSPATTRV